jgi:hypothetical protein
MVETVGFRLVIRFDMLKSTKDRVLGVDTPGQYVPPRVRYGMACLLIRDAMESVSCSDAWEFGARGAVVPRLPRETLAMLWYCILRWQSLAYDV